MRRPRCLLLLFLAGTFAVSLGEEEVLLPPTNAEAAASIETTAAATATAGVDSVGSGVAKEGTSSSEATTASTAAADAAAAALDPLENKDTDSLNNEEEEDAIVGEEAEDEEEPFVEVNGEDLLGDGTGSSSTSVAGEASADVTNPAVDAASAPTTHDGEQRLEQDEGEEETDSVGEEEDTEEEISSGAAIAAEKETDGNAVVGDDSSANSTADDAVETEPTDTGDASTTDDRGPVSTAAAEKDLGAEEGGAGEGGAGRDGFIGGWGKHAGGNGSGRHFKVALRSYDSLLKEHFLKMSFAQATTLGVMGDAIAQHLERRWNPGQRYEMRRTVHAGMLNMVIDGVFTPRWYNLVDRVNSDMTLPAALAKALAASVFYGPFANGAFLGGARLLRYGPKARFDWAEWRRQLLVCTVRDFQMWPPLHVLSFWLVPKHWRPLTSHLAGVALLAVISSTGLTDAALPLGQRVIPLVSRWARGTVDAVGERVRAKGRRVSGAPPARA